MPRCIVTLTNDEIQERKALIQKGGKGYRIKYAQILLKLDKKPENKAWTYDRIKGAYGTSRATIAGVAQRSVMQGNNGIRKSDQGHERIREQSRIESTQRKGRETWHEQSTQRRSTLAHMAVLFSV